MDIVPESRQLMVEARIKPQDKDMVHVGQAAEIQLTSLKGMPFVRGTVVYLSGDALEDKANQVIPRYYLCHLHVDMDHTREIGDIAIFPGMPVVAYIKTKTRSFFELVLKPLIDSASRGLRQDI